MTRQFRPTLVPSIAAVLVIALTVSLGNWQRGRAAEKQALQDALLARQQLPLLPLNRAQVNAAEAVFRLGAVRGTFDVERQIFLDNKDHQGKAGLHVLTPLQLEKSDSMVLVNRGWVARPASYPAVPRIDAPTGIVEVRGLLVTPPRRFLELTKNTAQGALWQNLTIERAATFLKQPVLPVVLLSDPPAPGLQKVQERPDSGIDKHRGYAFQWYSLAVLVAALWTALNFRKIAS